MVNVRRVSGTDFLVHLDPEMGDDLFWSVAEEVLTETLRFALRRVDPGEPGYDEVPF